MQKNTKKMMMTAAVLGGIGAAGYAGYMYMKKNPAVMENMKIMAKDVAKATYDKLEDIN